MQVELEEAEAWEVLNAVMQSRREENRPEHLNDFQKLLVRVFIIFLEIFS